MISGYKFAVNIAYIFQTRCILPRLFGCDVFLTFTPSKKWG